MKLSTNSALTEALRTGARSARENALPGLILWCFACAVVALYYLVPSVNGALSALGRLKAAGGYGYSALATALFGGFLPFFWRWLSHRGTPSPWKVPAWQAGLFLTLFWAYKGVEVDFFYRLQALMFGSGAGFSTIAPKVLMDQFVYNPLWAGWTQLLGYWWLESSFRPSALADRSFWGSLGPRLVTVLVSTWAVWIPMVSVIYAMPGDLQVPLFNIVLCFWGLMLASLTKE